jgi:hypothetical protein
MSRQSFSDLWEVPMTSSATEGACAFAWRHYLLRHNGISETDDRRSALYRYVSHLRNACEDDFDLLQIAAVAYLKKLDELHDDRGARTAVDKMLAARLETRGA